MDLGAEGATVNSDFLLPRQRGSGLRYPRASKSPEQRDMLKVRRLFAHHDDVEKRPVPSNIWLQFNCASLLRRNHFASFVSQKSILAAADVGQTPTVDPVQRQYSLETARQWLSES